MFKFINYLKKISNCIPEFQIAHWFLRIPISIVFIQQGFYKLPLNISEAESFGLPFFIWFLVAWSEIIAGFGLLLGGLVKHWFNDILTRFSGFIIVNIICGVIILSKPESLLDVILYDNLHVLLCVGGLFFALRGNRAN